MINGWQTISKNIFIGCNKRTHIYKQFYPDSWYQLIKFVNTIGKSPIQISKTAGRQVLKGTTRRRNFGLPIMPKILKNLNLVVSRNWPRWWAQVKVDWRIRRIRQYILGVFSVLYVYIFFCVFSVYVSLLPAIQRRLHLAKTAQKWP